MSETVTLRDDLGIIEIYSFGEPTEEDKLRTQNTVEQICQEKDVSGVLVDASKSTSIPTIFANLDYGANLFRYNAIPRTVRYAIVPSETIKEDCGYYVTVCQKRGLFIRLFDSVGKAEEWLVS